MAIFSIDKKCAYTVCTGVLTTDRKKNGYGRNQKGPKLRDQTLCEHKSTPKSMA
jgi:hypothetical protein